MGAAHDEGHLFGPEFARVLISSTYLAREFATIPSFPIDNDNDGSSCHDDDMLLMYKRAKI